MKRKEEIIHLLIWIIGFIAILEYVNTILDFRKEEGPFVLSVFFGTSINILVFYGTSLWLAPKFLPQRNIITLSFSLLGGFLLISLLESVIDFYWLVGYFSTEIEPFNSYLFYNSICNFFILLLALSYALIKYWIKNEQLKRVLLEEKLSTEMAFLKSQINPHFLFNVLNSLYAKSLRYQASELSDGIAKLSQLMRYMVYETNEELVALEREVEHLKNFIKVYQLRIAEDDDVLINFVIKGDMKPIKLSPMLLIPLVENAIKHGIDPKEKCVINIDLLIKEGNLNFEITNTIHQAIDELHQKHSGFGLSNLEKRLAVLYPNRHVFETKQEADQFVALLHLQLC